MDEMVYIFVSHSHQDIEKVRVLRNYLESINTEPILFFLKSLNDKDEIVELIKREIDARAWFIYCDSENAKNSTWVQTEKEYMMKTYKKSITLDLIDDFVDFDGKFELKERTKANLKYYIKGILDAQNVYISYSYRDINTINSIIHNMEPYNIKIYNIWHSNNNYSLFGDFSSSISDRIEKCNFFIIFISNNSFSGFNAQEILKIAKEKNVIIVPVLIDISIEEIRNKNIHMFYLFFNYLYFIFDSKKIEKSSLDLIYFLANYGIKDEKYKIKEVL